MDAGNGCEVLQSHCSGMGESAIGRCGGPEFT
jgi:hypothetical protein